MQMTAPDYDFWRAERVRLLEKKGLSLSDMVRATGTLSNAIDVILETEAAIHDLRVQIVRLEDIITDRLEKRSLNEPR